MVIGSKRYQKYQLENLTLEPNWMNYIEMYWKYENLVFENLRSENSMPKILVFKNLIFKKLEFENLLFKILMSEIVCQLSLWEIMSIEITLLCN